MLKVNVSTKTVSLLDKLYYSYMKLYLFAVSLFILTPSFALAQFSPSLQNFFRGLMTFFDSTLIPFMFGIAFLIFAINVVRYFVAGAGNKDVQENAKSVALYGVMAFVFITIFWGIVNMFVDSTGLEGCRPITSDYVQNKFMGPPLPPCP